MSGFDNLKLTEAADGRKPNREAALGYAARGSPVLPLRTLVDGACSCGGGAGCESPGKHPLTRHGFNDASADAADVRRWWAANPDANVGVVTGEASNVWVLDADGAEGRQAVAAWE